MKRHNPYLLTNEEEKKLLELAERAYKLSTKGGSETQIEAARRERDEYLAQLAEKYPLGN